MNELLDISGFTMWYFLMFYITLAEMVICEDLNGRKSLIYLVLSAFLWPIYFFKIILKGWYGYITNPKSFLE